MRTEPGEYAQAKGQFYTGYPLKVLAEINGWCLVLDESYGQAGYVLKTQLQRTNGMTVPDAALSSGYNPTEGMTYSQADEAMDDGEYDSYDMDGEETDYQG